MLLHVHINTQVLQFIISEVMSTAIDIVATGEEEEHLLEFICHSPSTVKKGFTSFVVVMLRHRAVMFNSYKVRMIYVYFVQTHLEAFVCLIPIEGTTIIRLAVYVKRTKSLVQG